MQMTSSTGRRLLVIAWTVIYSAPEQVGAQTIEWVSQLRSTSFSDFSMGISADGLGSVYITGYTLGDLDGVNAGESDAIVSKYSSDGSRQWSRQLGTSASDISVSVAADGLGNVYISGRTFGSLGGAHAGGWDAFLSKYDAAGDFHWTRQLGTSELDISEAVSTDGLGNVFIAGYTFGNLDGANAGNTDAFVSNYDANGVVQWTRQFGTSSGDSIAGASADGLGNVYVAGGTFGNLAGVNSGSSDAIVSKLDATGAIEWTRQFGSSAQDVITGVSADGTGHVYLTGYTEGSLGGPHAGAQDAFVSKFDSVGNQLWTRQLGTLGSEFSRGISADALGNVYITGQTFGSLGGPYVGTGGDMFIALYDDEGDLQWIKQLGTNVVDDAQDVATDGLGSAYITGRTNGNLTDPFVAGDVGMLVAKIAAPEIPEPTSLALWAIGAALAGSRYLARSYRP